MHAQLNPAFAFLAGFQIYESTAMVEQWRFPRSKRHRIRKK